MTNHQAIKLCHIYTCCIMISLSALLVCPFGRVLGFDHKELFPSYDEYDVTTFDYGEGESTGQISQYPLFGKPYGGYARASASRLASLPLKFTNDVGFHLKDEGLDDGIMSHHFTVRDEQGRMFVCRVYNETNLNEADVVASMFDVVQYPLIVNGYLDRSDKNELINEEQDENLEAKMAKSTPESEVDIFQWHKDGLKKTVEHVNTHDGGLLISYLTSDNVPTSIIRMFQKIVDAFEDIDDEDNCLTITPDYWTYKYCFRNHIEQFNNRVIPRDEVEDIVNLEDKNDGQLLIENKRNLKIRKGKKTVLASNVMTKISLGAFDEEKFILDSDLYSQATDIPSLLSSLALEQTYSGGSFCKINGKKRETTVRISCCDPDSAHTLNLRSVLENPEGSCSYVVNICSSELCANRIMETLDEKERGEDSVRLILERSLYDNCLIRGVDWWKYEFCYKKHIRQFHPLSLEVDSSGKTNMVIDKQYSLGVYIDIKGYHETEQDHIINPSKTLAEIPHAEGNGAYFVEEYQYGTPCSGDDVDMDITGVERSSTVRYFCGPKLELVEIKEDRTCHYIVDISVPDLCHNQHFLVTNDVKGQVVKCLPLPV